MNTQPLPPDEACFHELFAEAEEALVQGKTPPPLGYGETPPDAQPRLARDLECVHLLRQVLKAVPAVGDTPPPLDATAPLETPLPTGPKPPFHEPHPGIEPPLTSLGRFQIVRELGRGGFGVVLLAHDPQLGREVAVKVPRAEVLVSAEARERFYREARAAAGLDHPHLVQVYEAGEVGPICYIVSAYCPGPTLAQWLKQRPELMLFRSAAALTATLAEAVQHAHSRGVVHRDLKPANILLSEVRDQESGIKSAGTGADSSRTSDPWHPTPRITDFGLAKQLLEDAGAGQTHSGAIVGTPHYMSPEQAAGNTRNIGPTADIYALGVILYELLAGRPPFLGEASLDVLLQVQNLEPVSPSRVRPKLPRDLETICLKCLQKEPRKRYSSAQALADDLRRFLAGEPIQARPVGVFERSLRWCRRKPALAASGGLAALATAAALVFFAVLMVQTTHARDEAVRFGNEKADLAHSESVEKERANQEKERARQEAAASFFERSYSHTRYVDSGEGLLWMARSLQKAGDANARDLEQSIRRHLTGWTRYQHSLRAILTHPLPVRTVAFSPDGKYMLTTCFEIDGNIGQVQLWEFATAKPFGPPMIHQGEITAATFSLDGTMILTGCQDDKARLWDAATGNLIRDWPHDGAVEAVAISPDGKLVATCDDVAHLWEVATGNRIGNPLEHDAGITLVLFSPDGQTLLTGSAGDGQARLWNVKTRKQIGQILKHENDNWVTTAAFSTDSQRVLTGCTDETARLWNAKTGRSLCPPLRHDGAVRVVAFNPDGKSFLTCSDDNLARLWAADTFQQIGRPMEHDNSVWSAAYSPDGKMVVTSDDRTARLWDAKSGRPIGPPMHGSGTAVAFSPKGETVLAAGASEARLWTIGRGSPAGPLLPHPVLVRDVAFSQDGHTVLIRGDEAPAQLWDLQTEEKLTSMNDKRHNLPCVMIDPDAKFLLTLKRGEGGEPNLIQLWDVALGKPVGPPWDEKRGWMNVAFHPDGKSLVSIGIENNQPFAQRWEIETGKSVGPRIELPNSPFAVALSPDGTMFATAGPGNTASLWDLATAKAVGTPLEHRAQVNGIVFSPDGRKVFTASSDKTARLWDTATGKAIGAPLVHPHGVNFSPRPFTPDGKVLVACGGLAIWELATGKMVGPPLLHPGGGMTSAVSPDGKTILTGGYFGARLWHMPVPVPGDPERIVLWVEVLTGLTLDAHGQIHVLDAGQWAERRQRLERLGGSPSP